MFQQLRNNHNRSKRDKVTDILYDIDLFYTYLQLYGQTFEIWYFQNVFTARYWEYLGNFNWLNPQKQAFLHQGILSLILFKCYLHLENTSTMDKVVIREISHSINKFHINNSTNSRLLTMVKKAIVFVKDDMGNELENEILESMAWTLKNIILLHNTTNNEINQR